MTDLVRFNGQSVNCTAFMKEVQAQPSLLNELLLEIHTIGGPKAVIEFLAANKNWEAGQPIQYTPTAEKALKELTREIRRPGRREFNWALITGAVLADLYTAACEGSRRWKYSQAEGLKKSADAWEKKAEMDELEHVPPVLQFHVRTKMCMEAEGLRKARERVLEDGASDEMIRNISGGVAVPTSVFAVGQAIKMLYDRHQYKKEALAEMVTSLNRDFGSAVADDMQRARRHEAFTATPHRK